MTKLLYHQAEDLIFQAYFKDEIKPMVHKFCFCGTLAPDRHWRYSVRYPYTSKEYRIMEDALFEGLRTHSLTWRYLPAAQYEAALFTGMCAALEVLKQIHISRGEDITIRPLVKRVKNEMV